MQKAAPKSFKESVAIAFSKSLKPKSVTDKWYDLEGLLGKDRVVIVTKTHKSAMRANALMKLLDEMSETNKTENVPFAHLIIVCLGGFFDTVYDYLDNHSIKNVLLYSVDEDSNKLIEAYSTKNGRNIAKKADKQEADTDAKSKPKRAKKTKRVNIGVFTSKGGVGKTTISAHLAGALTIMGYETALIDLDPQSNLKRLIGESGIYIKNEKSGVGNTMSVLGAKEWDEEMAKEVKAIVCDCNPELDKNPTAFVKKFDFCIIPITLNPLGINKHASVVERTIEAVRAKNKKAKFLILINQYEPKEGKKNKILLDLLKAEVDRIGRVYDGVELIDPSLVSIRYSSQLFYWGLHTITGEKGSELAFEKIGARSIPKDDFYKLGEFVATYVEM